MTIEFTKKEPIRPTDKEALFEVIDSSLDISSAHRFIQWTQTDLQVVLPHEVLICGVGEIKKHSIHIQKYLCNNFPLEYVEGIRKPDGGVLSPIMKKWCSERRPQLFEPKPNGDASDWLMLFEKHKLRNIVAHGLHDINSAVTSYFNFSRIPDRITPRYAYILNILIPHLHVALTRVLADIESVEFSTDKPLEGISPREKEILHWLRHGKTNWEIAQILQISEKTVKNHVQHILFKLRVNNRVQAVSKVFASKEFTFNSQELY